MQRRLSWKSLSDEEDFIQDSTFLPCSPPAPISVNMELKGSSEFIYFEEEMDTASEMPHDTNELQMQLVEYEKEIEDYKVNKEELVKMHQDGELALEKLKQLHATQVEALEEKIGQWKGKVAELEKVEEQLKSTVDEVNRKMEHMEKSSAKLKIQLQESTMEIEKSRREYHKKMEKQEKVIQLLSENAKLQDSNAASSNMEHMMDKLVLQMENNNKQQELQMKELMQKIDVLQMENEQLKSMATSNVQSKTNTVQGALSTPTNTVFIPKTGATIHSSGVGVRSMHSRQNDPVAIVKESTASIPTEAEQRNFNTPISKVNMANSLGKIETQSVDRAQFNKGEPQRKKLESSHSVKQLLSYDTTNSNDNTQYGGPKPPFANDFDSHDRLMVNKMELEKQLMQLNLEKEQLLSELQKLGSSGGKTMVARKKKCSIEARLGHLTLEISAMKSSLKSEP